MNINQAQTLGDAVLYDDVTEIDRLTIPVREDTNRNGRAAAIENSVMQTIMKPVHYDTNRCGTV